MVKQIEILADRGYRLKKMGVFTKNIYKKTKVLGFIPYIEYDGYVSVIFGYDDEFVENPKKKGLSVLVQRRNKDFNVFQELTSYERNGNWDENFELTLKDFEK